jgi:uncharacterized protein (DUF1800 family)
MIFFTRELFLVSLHPIGKSRIGGIMKLYTPKEYSFEDASHLLRRAGFGGSFEDVEALRRLGPSLAVEKLLSFSSFDGTERNPHDLDEQFDKAKEAGRPVNQQVASTIPVAQAWWLYKMRTTRDPLKEKMTLFWHGHFVSGLDKVRNGFMLQTQNELFRRLAISKFETLTLEVAKDPAMLRYLDNNVNTKKKPNENFAREIMELFTMGVNGGYTERDIQEAARAFTGWTFIYRRNGNEAAVKNPEFVFNAKEHDTGNKTVLGQTGNWNGEDVVRILTSHSSTAKYMVTKLWNFFVSPKIPQATLNELAALWERSKGSVRDLLREIFNSEEFYAPENRFGLIKTPLEFVIGSLRASKADLEPQHESALSSVLARMAQIPFFPPDVSGWDGDIDWIADTTMLNRLQYMATLVSGSLPTSARANNSNIQGNGQKKIPSLEWVMGKTLAETIDLIGQTHLGSPPTGGLRRALEMAAKGRNTPEIAKGLAYLTMISPQYHLN